MTGEEGYMQFVCFFVLKGFCGVGLVMVEWLNGEKNKRRLESKMGLLFERVYIFFVCLVWE